MTNLSALKLMRQMGVSYPVVWRLKHKLLQAMSECEGGVICCPLTCNRVHQASR